MEIKKRMNIMCLSEICSISAKCIVDDTVWKSKIEDKFIIIFLREKECFPFIPCPGKKETDTVAESHTQLFCLRSKNCVFQEMEAHREFRS